MYFHFTAYVSLSYLFMFVVLSFSLRERNVRPLTIFGMQLPLTLLSFCDINVTQKRCGLIKLDLNAQYLQIWAEHIAITKFLFGHVGDNLPKQIIKTDGTKIGPFTQLHHTGNK